MPYDFLFLNDNQGEFMKPHKTCCNFFEVNKRSQMRREFYILLKLDLWWDTNVMWNVNTCSGK